MIAIAEPIPRLADPDAERMVRVREGDTAAFAELVRDYWPTVIGRFINLLGDRQEAEDLAQEVFLRLYRARTRYQPHARFSTWFFHIVTNVARNALRSRRRRLGPNAWLHLDPALDQSNDSRTCQDFSPSRRLEREELAHSIRDALAGLDTRHRLALEWQCEETTYEEIARRLDISPSATKSLLYRARQRLKSSLTHLADPM